MIKRIPRGNRFLASLGIIEPGDHWRDYSMTFQDFQEFCKKAGLYCYSQELINWVGGTRLIDCISVFGKTPGKKFRYVENPGFATEILQAKRIFATYSND